MKKKRLITLLCMVSFMICLLAAGTAMGLDPIKLPQPVMKGGMPLLDAMMARHSTKEFSTKPVSMEMISNLLWAAFGINRPDSGKRTAPSAMNKQNTDIYVLFAKGTYLWDGKANVLNPVIAEDLRDLVADRQDYPKTAPVHLVFVADYSKMPDFIPPDLKAKFCSINVGVICQNIGLFCESSGLGGVVRTTFNIPELTKKRELNENQDLLANMVLGYPK